MRFLPIISSLILLSICLSCDKNSIETDPDYPTIVSEISNDKANEIIDKFAQTPMYYCMLVDTFGFPYFDVEFDSMCINEDWEIDNSIEEIETRATNALVEYADLLNINKDELITINSVSTNNGTTYEEFNKTYPDSLPNTWIAKTQLQRYDDLFVRGTFLEILLSPDEVIGIRGHWYDYIYIPSEEKFDEEKAKELLYNKTFEYRNTTIIPSENITWHNSQKLIVPVRRSDDKIELHVCWALYPSSWEIIVDSETGEIISSVNINKI